MILLVEESKVTAYDEISQTKNAPSLTGVTREEDIYIISR